MILKQYNARTGLYEPIQITVSQTYTDSDTGTIIKAPSKFGDLQKSIDSKLSKSGDTMLGTIEFGNNFGIKGSNVQDINYKTSKIIYNSEDSNTNCFQVRNEIFNLESDSVISTPSVFNLKIDNQPIQNSINLLTSGAIYNALQQLSNRISALE